MKHSKVLADTQFSNHSAHGGAIFSRKGFEHTVLHDITERAGVRSIVGDTVVIAKALDFTVVLVKDFEVIVILEVIPCFRFPVASDSSNFRASATNDFTCSLIAIASSLLPITPMRKSSA